MDKPFVSIIMPAYNEAHHIVPSVQETIRVGEENGWNYEIVVVDDGSHDGTFVRIQELAHENPRVVPVHIPRNAGKGSALRRGFRASRRDGEYVAFLDCDLDLHPGQILTLFEVMKRTGADVVIGSKRHRLSKVNYPWHRRIVSRVYFTLVHLLFSRPLHIPGSPRTQPLVLRDTQTGLKLFRRDVLRKVFPKLLVKRWAFDLELLALSHYYGFRIAHAPVVLHSRRHQSRIRPWDVLCTFWDTLAVFYRLRILHWYQRRKPT